jgi:hypothetical protein
VDCKRIELFKGRIGSGIEFYVVGFYPSNTIMMNDDGEREEMVVYKCTKSSDKETLVM